MKKYWEGEGTDTNRTADLNRDEQKVIKVIIIVSFCKLSGATTNTPVNTIKFVTLFVISLNASWLSEEKFRASHSRIDDATKTKSERFERKMIR